MLGFRVIHCDLLCCYGLLQMFHLKGVHKFLSGRDGIFNFAGD